MVVSVLGHQVLDGFIVGYYSNSCQRFQINMSWNNKDYDEYKVILINVNAFCLYTLVTAFVSLDTVSSATVNVHNN